MEQALRHIDDEHLKLSAGDEAAWRGLVLRCVPLLYGMFIKKGINAALAEELTQKSIFDAVRSREQIDVDKGLAESWLMAIGRNNLADEMRKRAVFRNKEADIAVWLRSLAVKLMPDEVLELEETRQLVRDAMDSIDDREKQALVLKYVDDLSARQIAGKMLMSEKAVHSLLYRARISLRDKLVGLSR